MCVGSASHMAPEQIEGANYSGEKLDVWSFAIIVHFLLAGYNPFESNRTMQESIQNIKNADLSNLSPLLSPDARDLITKCLSRDFNERPSWEDISRVSRRLFILCLAPLLCCCAHASSLQHPWLQGETMHVALMHRRATFPLIETGIQADRGSLASIDESLTRLHSLAQTHLKELGMASRVRDKGIDCAMMGKGKHLKFRLTFNLVSMEDLQLIDHSGNSSSDFEDERSVSSGSLSRTSSSGFPPLSASKEKEALDKSGSKDKDALTRSDSDPAIVLLPSRLSQSSAALPAPVVLEHDCQQQWLVSAELLVGDPPQFEKVFRRLCLKCSPPGKQNFRRSIVA
jgi:serine/threonine protein kinase